MPETADLKPPPELAAQLAEVAVFASEQLERYVAAWPSDRAAPVHTVDGKWYRPAELWTDWTPGFFAGQLWILSRLAKCDASIDAEKWLRRAEEYTERLKHRRHDRDVHDLGFVLLSSYGRWIDALDAGDPRRQEIEDVLVTAATVQSFRYNSGGEDEFIYSFNGPQSLFIDIMMNVRLLFWASTRGAEPEVLRRAMAHCHTSARYLVRRDGPSLGAEDGSVAHEAIFNTDPGRGEFRCLSTQQGYSPFSCWSRGLAWALYGFAEAYRYVQEPEFLETAERCAKYYLKHTPENGVPPWDYGAPGLPDEPDDSSAAAIAGCGFHILAQQVSDGSAEGEARAGKYREACHRIAGTLSGPDYLAKFSPAQEGILLHGVYHRPNNWGVDASVPWGEYFFLELVERLLLS